jgi:hypothetical protein
LVDQFLPKRVAKCLHIRQPNFGPFGGRKTAHLSCVQFFH